MCVICGCGEADGTEGPSDASREGHVHSHDGHSHDGHSHDGHSHDGHSHDGHSHDGHSHDGHSHDGHSHSHGGHVHSHAEHPASQHGHQERTIRLERAILDKNDRIAERNRGFFAGRSVLALNLMSSPGSGKTTLLERTVGALRGRVPLAVLEGDQATDRDAARIRAAGAHAIQINTGAGCHLDADMVSRSLDALGLVSGGVLFIENVGNLVCPALFDLGEAAKVVVCSVTEGEDKPIKYPHMFRRSQLMLVNKVDLLPYVDFDVAACVAHARQVNPQIEVLEVSARDGTGLETWIAWIEARR